MTEEQGNTAVIRFRELSYKTSENQYKKFERWNINPK